MTNLFKFNNYTCYLILYIFLLITTLTWALFNFKDLYIILYGFLGSSFCFILLIRIEYPQSLNKHQTRPFNLISYITKYKASLIGILSGICFVFGLPLLAEGPLFFLLVIPAFLFALAWAVFVSCLTVFIVKIPSIFKQIKQWRVNTKLVKKSNKKLIIFFKSRPHALKNPIVLILAFMTWFSNSSTLCFLVAGYSWRFHNGLEFYLLFFIVILLTLIVTLPCFRSYMFKKYGSSSLRLLGWNGPEINLLHVVTKGGVAAGFVLGSAIAAKSVILKDEKITRAWEQGERDTFNKNTDIIRDRDPASRCSIR